MQITRLGNGKYIIDTLGQYEADFLDKVCEAFMEWQKNEYPVFKSVHYTEALENGSGQSPQERD